MLFLLKYWQPIAAALLTAILAFGAHRLDVYHIEDAHRAALSEQAAAMKKQCNDIQQASAEVSNDYQEKIADLGLQLAAVKRLRPSKCVVPDAGAAPGHHAAAGAGQFAEAHGVASDALYDFAADAERYRLQLVGCQNWVKGISRNIDSREGDHIP